MKHPSIKSKYYAVYQKASAALEQHKELRRKVKPAYVAKLRKEVADALNGAMWNGAKSVRADVWFFAYPINWWLSIKYDDPEQAKREHAGRLQFHNLHWERFCANPDYCLAISPQSPGYRLTNQ